MHFLTTFCTFGNPNCNRHRLNTDQEILTLLTLIFIGRCESYKKTIFVAVSALKKIVACEPRIFFWTYKMFSVLSSMKLCSWVIILIFHSESFLLTVDKLKKTSITIMEFYIRKYLPTTIGRYASYNRFSVKRV